MNRNWFKMLVPEAVMVVLVLAVFFLCRCFGLEAVALIAFVAIATAFDALDVVVAALAALVALVAVLAIPTSLAALVVVVAFIIPVLVALTFTKEYKLPMFWVVVSYSAEAAAIFLPIYLSLG